MDRQPFIPVHEELLQIKDLLVQLSPIVRGKGFTAGDITYASDLYALIMAVLKEEQAQLVLLSRSNKILEEERKILVGVNAVLKAYEDQKADVVHSSHRTGVDGVKYDLGTGRLRSGIQLNLIERDQKILFEMFGEAKSRESKVVVLMVDIIRKLEHPPALENASEADVATVHSILQKVLKIAIDVLHKLREVYHGNLTVRSFVEKSLQDAVRGIFSNLKKGNLSRGEISSIRHKVLEIIEDVDKTTTMTVNLR